MNIKYILYLIIFVLVLVGVVIPDKAAAAGGCFTINNGGPTNQQYCPPSPSTATLSLTEAAPTKAPDRDTQPVFPSSQSKTTPDTGPEDWVLPSLTVLGGLGFFLRKKAKIS